MNLDEWLCDVSTIIRCLQPFFMMGQMGQTEMPFVRLQYIFIVCL